MPPRFALPFHFLLMITLIGSALLAASSNDDADRGAGLGSAATALSFAADSFDPDTPMHFTLPEDVRVTLRIHDRKGRIVKTLLENEFLAAGSHEVAWDGTDDKGRTVASGVYSCRLGSDRHAPTGRILIVR